MCHYWVVSNVIILCPYYVLFDHRSTHHIYGSIKKVIVCTVHQDKYSSPRVQIFTLSIHCSSWISWVLKLICYTFAYPFKFFFETWSFLYYKNQKGTERTVNDKRDWTPQNSSFCTRFTYMLTSWFMKWYTLKI